MSILATRLMVSLLPEDLLLDKAIEALTQYKKERENAFKNIEQEPANSFDSLKARILGKKEEESPIELNKPISEVMSLLVKWRDMDKSKEEIIASSIEIESLSNRKD